MATIVLSMAGAAIGGSVGGSFVGLSAAAVGRFAGATLGRALDQRLMGQGTEAVETGRVDRFRLSGAGEGAPIVQVYGRVRVGGHVIWATEFTETVNKRGGGGGGKGAPKEPEVRNYSYKVSLALALCEGEIAAVDRVWADGIEIAVADLNMSVYTGSSDQLPDPHMEAVEGKGMVPAYRGTAYVVIENLNLTRFGNRIPQFNFEVTRPDLKDVEDVPLAIQGVSMIPGTGEYSLSTVAQYLQYGRGNHSVQNVNSPSERPDFNTSFKMLESELPNCKAVSLVVSWFGSDLRCSRCVIKPKVEQTAFDAKDMPWRVSGLARNRAEHVAQEAGRAVYGGTPADAAVVQSIRRMVNHGQVVMFYPFILMEQLAGNGLADPYLDGQEQPALPWRGRVTLDAAPGRNGSADGTADARAEVAAFFGTVRAAHFDVSGDEIVYAGPQEWSYSRFILHYAALCKAAGGVSAFCIGSELRGLTQIRDDHGFPAVNALRALLTEVRSLLGADVKLGYAADWSEYFGFHPQDGSGDVYFHLDPLWGDDQIDFVGIDNYMPISDWRDGDDHSDAEHGSIYDLSYLQGNVAGGEGYDWYYPSSDAAAFQRREPITDADHDEPWIFRYKDIRNWWSKDHHQRIGGVREDQPTAWIPGSKPIWFTELGCAAVDKGTNEPNKFVDPKSSESALPKYSNGLRDEFIQRQYLRAMHGFWNDPKNNPGSDLYSGRMVDMSRAFVWAWDARPYPWFPNNEVLWSDGPNYRRGHWLNGRVSSRTLASVVGEICDRAGLAAYDTSCLFGLVRGYSVPQTGDARHALQPLMLAYGFDAIERDGTLVFRMRTGRNAVPIRREDLATSDEIGGDLQEIRGPSVEMAGRVRLRFLQADGDHQIVAEETVLPDDQTHAVSESDMDLVLTRAEGRQTLERWLSEARLSRDTLRFALPTSKLALGAGDIVSLASTTGPVLARIDRVETTTQQLIDAVRIDPGVYEPSHFPDEAVSLRPVKPLAPVLPLFLDLPLMTGDEVPHAPHIALYAKPWPGSVAIYDSPTDSDYVLNDVIAARSAIGTTETPLFAAPSGQFDRSGQLQVKMSFGTLESISDAALLAGKNLMAIGDGTSGNWELFQFRDAQMIAEGTWLLSHRLRGQLGTDAVQPAIWPAGSHVVLMDGTPQQIGLAASSRRLVRHFRIGPAQRANDDSSYIYERHAFDGNGLRPYSPVHLTTRVSADGLILRWVRRTRIDGDSWDSADVPLGEEVEQYVVRILLGQSIVREVITNRSEWTYSASMQAQDGLSGPFDVAVAQVSARFGTGPFSTINWSG